MKIVGLLKKMKNCNYDDDDDDDDIKIMKSRVSGLMRGELKVHIEVFPHIYSWI